MNSIESLVHVEIQDRLEEMSEQSTTTEEYKATSEVTLKLIDRYAKMAEIENQAKITDLKQKELELQAEANKLKAEELKEAKKHRWTDFAKDMVKVVVPTTATIVAAIGLSVYEHTEVNASTPTREFWKKVFRLS